MSFDAVVFGSYIVGTGFTDGDSIPSGGLSLFARIVEDIGDTPISVTITYVDQYGNTPEVVGISTSIAAFETAGTRIPIVLNSGDTGIRDITAVSITGGTVGDSISFESYNEGIGKTINIATRGLEPTQFLSLTTKNYAMMQMTEHKFYEVILDGVERNANGTFQLETETHNVNTETELNYDSGFADVYYSQDNIGAYFNIKIDTDYVVIDSEYQRASWKYTASGLFRLQFIYDVNLDATKMRYELVNDAGVVKWWVSGNVNGEGDVTMDTESFSFRLRIIANHTNTTVGLYAKVLLPIVHRYKLAGVMQMMDYRYNPNTILYHRSRIVRTTPAGSLVQAHMRFSDNGSTWTGWIGPDGTSSTFITDLTVPNTGGYTGKYYQIKMFLLGTGMTTPIFTSIMTETVVWISGDDVPWLLSYNTDGSPVNPYNTPSSAGPLRMMRELDGGYMTPPTYATHTSAVVDLAARAECDSFLAQTLSKRAEAIIKIIRVVASFPESEFGQKVSGYVLDQDENVITGAIKMVITSTLDPSYDIMCEVDPVTGFYQAFFKNTIYDARFLLVEISDRAFSAGLEGFGTPAEIDGGSAMTTLNLHFFLPNLYCPKAAAHVGSLVSY